jgi:hypothetical protein
MSRALAEARRPVKSMPSWYKEAVGDAIRKATVAVHRHMSGQYQTRYHGIQNKFPTNEDHDSKGIGEELDQDDH